MPNDKERDVQEEKPLDEKWPYKKKKNATSK